MPKLEEWISKETIHSMYSSSYWNDIENDMKKPWWIETPNDTRLLDYLNQAGLKSEVEKVIDAVQLHGNILDMAAGTCWLSAILSQNEKINRIDAVEFSLHRIEKLAPITIEAMNGHSTKINRILGSFYDIHRNAEYYDSIVLSQAFHHAQYPLKLFHECDRVLKRGGTIIMIGEHIITPMLILKNIIKSFLNGRPIFSVHSLFYHHNDPLGDHHYHLSDYEFLFFSYGYSLKILKSNLTNSYILIGHKES